MMKTLWKRIFGNHDDDKLNEVSIGRTIATGQQLSNVEISLLRLLEGKRADDPTVLRWWCSSKNVDGSKIIKKLTKNNYLTLADYKFNIGKASIPVLKDFLGKRGLPAKGEKIDLVNRIIENISEADCSSYFKQSYWALTVQAVELLRLEQIEAETEYNKNIELLRKGAYDELKSKLYPNQKEHWGTEDTFVDTIDFVMEHGFEEFRLSEDVRRDISSFVAARAVDYSSRGYSTCKENVSNYLRSLNTPLEILKPPHSLSTYAREKEIENSDKIFEIYIQFIINRARGIAELNNYKHLGYKKIRIDTLGCRECKRSEGDKTHNINKAPVLPLSWNCQCIYSPLLRDK